jgi:hypothetical protein
VKHSEKVAPVAALVSAVSCMACCLPLGFAAAAGFAGLGVALEPIRPWLMAISVVLLLVGLWQLYWRPAVCRRSRLSLVIFWVSATIVVTMIVAPQLLAGWLADL